jgi:hypothetical protein
MKTKQKQKYIDLYGNTVCGHSQIETGCLVEWDRTNDIFHWLVDCGIHFSVLKPDSRFILIASGNYFELIQQGFNDAVIGSIRDIDIGACHGYAQTYKRIEDCVVILLNNIPTIVFRCLIKQTFDAHVSITY